MPLLLLLSSPNNNAFGLLSPSSNIAAAGGRRTRHSSFHSAELSSSDLLPIIPTADSLLTTQQQQQQQQRRTNEEINWSTVTTEWEMDCYSRPVLLEDKKKLWEVLVTDSSGTLRICAPLASNKVNSREVRRVIEEIITGSEVKPEIIRFFRGAMFNMVRLDIYIYMFSVIYHGVVCVWCVRACVCASFIEEEHRPIHTLTHYVYFSSLVSILY